MNSKNSNGFSLLELIIVISIVSILATIATLSYQNITRKSQRNLALHVLQHNVLMIAKYYRVHGRYVDNSGNYPTNIIQKEVKHGEDVIYKIDFGSNTKYAIDSNADKSKFSLIATPIESSSQSKDGSICINQHGEVYLDITEDCVDK